MRQDFFKLSKKEIKGLMIYYFIILIISIVIIIPSILFESIKHQLSFEISISAISIIGGIGTALCGSAIFYLRKLYKSSININSEGSFTNIEQISGMGYYAYFFLRPWFAIVFSILIHIVLKSGIHVITLPETQLSEGFIYLSLILSFFAGFSAGDAITLLESRGKDFIEKAFNNY